MEGILHMLHENVLYSMNKDFYELDWLNWLAYLHDKHMKLCSMTYKKPMNL